jgi:hypothetical protein
MLPRWQGGIATAVVIASAVVLVVLDIANRGVEHFWDAHSLTVDTLSGLLVVAVTVLIVDQVVRRRQLTGQSRVVAAHAGIILAQARRSVQAAKSAQDAGADRSEAGDELRNYLLMLLVGAPVLIDSPVARRFLEQAQALGAEIASIVSPSDLAGLARNAPPGGLDQAVERLRAAAAPLLAVLSAAERSAVTDESG